MVLGVLIASFCSIFVNLHLSPVHAATEPPADWSFYVQMADTTTAYNLGHNQGTYDASHSNSNSEVVLDFGGQKSDLSGAIMVFNAGDISNAQIESVAENFARGYYGGTGADTISVLTLGIGTNNSAYHVDYNGGYQWAQLVGTINTYVQQQGWGTQVHVIGANDIEPGFDDYADTYNWVQGYAGYGSAYLNYGSADGCSQTDSSGTSACNNGIGGWTQADVWYVSWGAFPAMPLPEIYYSSMALQWTMISLYGAQHKGGAVPMQGPWDEYDECPSTLTSAQAWTDFSNDLNSYSQTKQTMPYAAEIHTEGSNTQRC
jgi:hypothetical protein